MNGGPSAGENDMKDFFEVLFSHMDKNDEAFRRQVDLQKGMIKRYQEQIAKEMSRDPINDMMADFSRTIMSAAMEVASYHRENRKRFLEMQSSIAEAYLNLLEKMESSRGSSTGNDDGTPDAK
jgi:hypothetical protein